MDSKPKYTLRVDKNLLEKISYIGEANSRSANKEIEFIMKKHVIEYEKENGAICLPSENE